MPHVCCVTASECRRARKCYRRPSPLTEQTAIVEYLDTQTAKLDAAIASAQREIDLIREFRTRLIVDVVTGKVDVREAAKNLREEPEEEIEPMHEEAEPEETAEVSKDKEAAVQ